MKLVASAATALSFTGFRQFSAQLPRVTYSSSSKRHASNDPTNQYAAAQLSMQHKREWKIGDVYAPHDLSPAEMRKWNKRRSPTKDVFDILAVNPLSLYKVLWRSPV